MQSSLRLLTTPILAGSSRLSSSTTHSEPVVKQTFRCSDLTIEKCSANEMQEKPTDMSKVKFGAQFADHMSTIDWDSTNGWMAPRITPLRNMSLHPAAKVLHYAAELFEGMKAYRGVDNKIRLFRPEMNMARMNRTAARAALPTFDEEELIKVISELVKVDRDWVPYSDVASLYLRPTLIGTEGTLGVGESSAAKLFVLTGPAGAYYPTGFQPVSLLADAKNVRAFEGGVGAYKMGSNYQSTILIGKEAAAKGCQQVLWLYGKEEEVTEVGTMNLFMFWKNEQGEDELITPSLDKGIILPGVTRHSLLELAASWNEFKISERNFTMEELKRANKEKRLYQVFGSGTACVVSPVGKILHKNQATGSYDEIIIPTMASKNNVMQRLYDSIMDIQYGRVDVPGWTRIVS
uniref:Branched-chain-amino-acid aminotransferase n=1 Tax=Rhabditophanes sp. KR3021 TaxID=114890 RepID=A0AC35U4S6_9BILA